MKKARASVLVAVLVAVWLASAVHALPRRNAGELSADTNDHRLPPAFPASWNVRERFMAVQNEARARQQQRAMGDALSNWNPKSGQTLTIDVDNQQPAQVTPAKLQFNIIPGGTRPFIVVIVCISICAIGALCWCCRDILLRPTVGFLETCGYWTWKTGSFIPFQLWEGLKICVYPLKQAAFAITDSCQQYMHPASRV